MNNEDSFDLENEDTKLCRTCLEIKSFEAFSKDASKKDGLSTQCKECYKKYHNQNADRINARRKVHHHKYKDRAKAAYKVWYANNFSKVRDKFYKSKYGITVEQVESAIQSQNNKCKICEDELEAGRKTHVDHDHNTGKFRGVLCHNCNTKLGWYEKNSAKVEKYLSENAEVDVKQLIPSHAFLH